MKNLTTEQKVRIARKLISKEMENENSFHEDVSMWGAPSECHTDVNKMFDKIVKKIFDMLNLSFNEWDSIMESYIKQEAKFTDKYEPPMAFYQCVYVCEHLRLEC